MKLKWGWLDPFCFALPSSQGNTKMTCYSCAGARNHSMSLILDFQISQQGIGSTQNVCVNQRAQKYFLISGLLQDTSLCVWEVALSEDEGEYKKRRERIRKRRGLFRVGDCQSPHLKTASRFYNQLRNADMNRLLLFYTEQWWATSSKYLYLTTFVKLSAPI